MKKLVSQPLILMCWAWFLMCSSGSAVAGGQECGERAAVSAEALARGLALGERVREQLERSGASSAFIGRIGLDLSEYGQRFTHLGVAVRDHVRKRWQVLHLMNACGKSESDILLQPLEKFYAVSLFEEEAFVLIPSYTKQALLRTAFMNPLTAKRLHTPAYNLIAHPFNTRFQNSNQWILETSALALVDSGSIHNRSQAQEWLKQKGFVPGSIRISNLKRSGARLFSAHVSFADHTEEEYQKQAYQVVTVAAIEKFLTSQDTQMTQLVIR
jgi:hypothetical protein